MQVRIYGACRVGTLLGEGGGVLGWYLPTLLKLPGSVFVIRSTSARQTGVEAYLVGKSRKSEQ